MNPVHRARTLAPRVRRAVTSATASPAVLAAWQRRLPLLATTLDRPLPSVPPTGGPGGAAAVAARALAVVEGGSRDEVWLALAVLSGVLPADDLVAEVTRENEFDGGAAFAAALLEATTERAAARSVRVTGPAEVLVDVSATLPLTFTTGIQRVIRETVPRWMTSYGALPVAWTPGFTALREVTDDERARLLAKEQPRKTPESVDPDAVVVPWRATYLTPEVLAEVARANQVRSLAMHARCRTGALVYDCVPLTSSETLIDWGADTFAWHLSALRNVDRLAAISESAADEFRGWKRSLASIGRTGPAVDAVLLPVESPAPADEDVQRARERFLVAGLPFVLVVGSAEPRKNQLAVLHCAEKLWREGLRFSLTFVGGRSWGAGTFAKQVAGLQESGRPVEIASGVDDRLLTAAYRLARFTVFPSLNEGFGLPVAESLACGTPAVTSGFGSMREIAADGGALLVDPRSTVEIADAMRRLLQDDALLAELEEAARRRPARTWDEYAAQTWGLLVG